MLSHLVLEKIIYFLLDWATIDSNIEMVELEPDVLMLSHDAHFTCYTSYYYPIRTTKSEGDDFSECMWQS